jgi:peptide/nickel transport system substrate-binding protein
MISSRNRAILILALAAGACRGGERAASTGDVGGTIIIAAPADPGSLVPQLALSTVDKQIDDQLFDYLAEIGPDLNTVGDKGWIPRLAQSWTWSSDSMSIAFHLDPRAKWHDGPGVRASDVRFTLDLYKDPRVKSNTGSSLENIDSVAVADSLTAVVWFKHRSPEQFFQIAYNLLVTPEHLLKGADRANLGASDFARHPVGSGPFRFVSWTPRATVELAADTTYYLGRPKLDRVIWSWNPDPGAALTKVLSGEADFTENLPPDGIARVAATPSVHMVPYRSINYSYLVFNLRDAKSGSRPHRLFADRETRIALSMAIDRQAMLRNVFDTLGTLGLGPFGRSYATADTAIAQIPYDSAGAVRKLDSLGWRDSDGDGVRERKGVPLRFSLMVPTSSMLRRRYAVLIQAQLQRVGAHVDIAESDPSVFMPRMLGRHFDAMLHSWVSDPAPSALRQSWSSSALNGANFGAYENPRVDVLIDSAVAEFDPARAKEMYRRAYRMIIDDAPAVWLYEAVNRAVVHTRIEPVLGSSDYWWRDMRLWSIPPDKRIDRDRIGVRGGS